MPQERHHGGTRPGSASRVNRVRARSERCSPRRDTAADVGHDQDVAGERPRRCSGEGAGLSRRRDGPGQVKAGSNGRDRPIAVSMQPERVRQSTGRGRSPSGTHLLNYG